ncbi:MAG TPA: hypothetical protein VFF75_10090 [Methylophilaceae bacterium]|nr:hypothetical protein [Methylophilaceae bacterium]
MKNFLLAFLLAAISYSATAGVSTKNFRSLINDEIFISDYLPLTILDAPNLEYGSGKLWLQGIMIFDLFFYPEPISLTFEIEEPDETLFEVDFSSSYVSPNFPCGHFGDWAHLGFFPTTSSDTNLQDCGKGLPSKSSMESLPINLKPIPEPRTQALILLGLMLMGFVTRQGVFHRI